MPMQGMGRITGAETTSLVLNEVEIMNLFEFVSKHQKCGAGWPTRFNIESTPNGIACAIHATCTGCNEKVSISDMDSW